MVGNEASGECVATTFIAIPVRCFMHVAKSIRRCEGWNLLDDNFAYVSRLLNFRKKMFAQRSVKSQHLRRKAISFNLIFRCNQATDTIARA